MLPRAAPDFSGRTPNPDSRKRTGGYPYSQTHQGNHQRRVRQKERKQASQAGQPGEATQATQAGRPAVARLRSDAAVYEQLAAAAVQEATRLEGSGDLADRVVAACLRAQATYAYEPGAADLMQQAAQL